MEVGRRLVCRSLRPCSEWLTADRVLLGSRRMGVCWTTAWTSWWRPTRARAWGAVGSREQRRSSSSRRLGVRARARRTGRAWAGRACRPMASGGRGPVGVRGVGGRGAGRVESGSRSGRLGAVANGTGGGGETSTGRGRRPSRRLLWPPAVRLDDGTYAGAVLVLGHGLVGDGCLRSKVEADGGDGRRTRAAAGTDSTGAASAAFASDHSRAQIVIIIQS